MLYLHNTIEDNVWRTGFYHGVAMSHGIAFADDGFGNYVQCSALVAFNFTFSDGDIYER
jgi:hypothetical protein